MFKDKYGKDHEVYYKFDLFVPQRVTIASQMTKFKNIRASDVKILPSFDAKKYLWILKPSWMSRGRGLELFTDLDQMQGFVKMYLGGYDAKDFKAMNYNDRVDRSPSLSVGKSIGPKKKSSSLRLTEKKTLQLKGIQRSLQHLEGQYPI